MRGGLMLQEMLHPTVTMQDLSSLHVSSLFDVKGKVVLVTGGGSGIGLMITSAFVANGAKVYIVSRKKKVVDQVAAALTKMGPGTCHAFAADVSTDATCKEVAERLSKLESTLDVLVNNAGCNWGEDYETYPEAAFDKVLALNVKAVFLLTRALTPLLQRTGDGIRNNRSTVINIGSIDGLRIPPMDTYAYSASKSAVHHLSRHLASRLGDRGINVNAIAAGPFQSKMMAVTLERMGDIIRASTLCDRIGEAGDVGGLCLFLSSRAGEWVTGTIMTLDGGVVARAAM